ncbi:hypothetical protein BU25DRAFT_226214 [Macroventuria anomochaeta]|uniref:Uncharacterized protein n=1 Tax=Macroventuria anomochaeta TaxID=301207 RepID=A0ACB6SAB9_9PLEO|nr:uncharacterized protein BU25DRAFT_226214 [Macroventuria anomochaeta]KAF2631220.1 hypothetical protein BU25DRAFT_226214 [Macroventuria anomochaeta]
MAGLPTSLLLLGFTILDSRSIRGHNLGDLGIRHGASLVEQRLQVLTVGPGYRKLPFEADIVSISAYQIEHKETVQHACGQPGDERTHDLRLPLRSETADSQHLHAIRENIRTT